MLKAVTGLNCRSSIPVHKSSTPRLFVVPSGMSTTGTPPTPTAPAPHRWWQEHGNTAQWAAVIIALLGGFGSIALTLYFHHAEQQSKSSDEHTDVLIEAKQSPAIEKMTSKIEKLTDKVNELSERVAHIEGPLTKRISTLESRADQQRSLAKLMDPARVLATIRAELRMAETSGRTLPASDLNDYKNAVRSLPTSAYEYWMTIAAIINYQSLLNQMSGRAPDPATVSRPCPGLTEGTGGNNIFFGSITFSRCVVDLDSTHNVLQGVTFKDSVVRYHGGQVMLSNVTFVNCRFVLDLPPATAPAKPAILFALLDSPDQRVVKVSTSR